MIRKFLAFIFSAFIFSSFANAYVGTNLTLPLIDKDPDGLHGFKASLWYQPESFIWKHWQIFFDAGYGDWWINGHASNRQLSIYSIAPVFRMYFRRNPFISPYMDLSIGASYITQTRFDTRNLGMHFSFQDQVAFGATIGKEQRLSISLSAMHYSNGSLCDHNAGITIPLLINIGYRF